jgi:hypothetical protein
MRESFYANQIVMGNNCFLGIQQGGAEAQAGKRRPDFVPVNSQARINPAVPVQQASCSRLFGPVS